MKIRSSFVTNSSSSNFLVKFSDEDIFGMDPNVIPEEIRDSLRSHILYIACCNEPYKTIKDYVLRNQLRSDATEKEIQNQIEHLKAHYPEIYEAFEALKENEWIAEENVPEYGCIFGEIVEDFN